MPIAAAVDATTSELAREIAVMKRLNHPNVVKLFEVGTVPQGLQYLQG
jgi:serine/threonine protein kinase